MKVTVHTKNQEDLRVNFKKQLTDGKREMTEISLGSGAAERLFKFKTKSTI